MLKKKKGKPGKDIECVLTDWNGEEILLPKSVLKRHLANAAHDDAHQYVETLKANISSPESVVKSRYRSNTKIANIRLTGREYDYLHVVIRYGSVFDRLRGKKNYIVTFYPENFPKKGDQAK